MDAASLLLGIAIGLVAGLALARLQRTPTLGQSPSEPAATPGSPAAGEGPGHRLFASPVVVKHQARVVVGPAGIQIEADGRTYRSIEDIPDTALRERMRSVLADMPGTVLDDRARERLEAELRDAGVDLEHRLPAGTAWPDAAPERLPDAGPPSAAALDAPPPIPAAPIADAPGTPADPGAPPSGA